VFAPYPAHRPRRLRRDAATRALVREHRLAPEDFILPVFVLDGTGGVFGSGKITCRWFNMPFIHKLVAAGQEVIVYGKVKDSNGRPIFLTALEAPTAGGIGSILGYGVVPSHAAPTTNAANAKIAVFGDPSGLVVGLRNGFEMEASDHAGFTTYERYFRGVARAGVKVRRSQAFAVLTLPAN
jgi:hypothetical protein